VTGGRLPGASRVLAALLCLAAATTARADAGASPWPFQAGFQAALGYEHTSSPLIRVSDDGTLIFIEGLSRLAGAYGQTAVNGMGEWAGPGDSRLALTARIDWKHSPEAPDLDFGQFLADAAWHWPLSAGTLGIGPSWQRLWVAGDHFRDVVGLRADWTRAGPDGSHWIWLLEAGRNRHADFYRDLDSLALSLSLHRHLAATADFAANLDLEAGLALERNRHGFDDLSSRSAFLRLGIDRDWQGMNWSLGIMAQLARFDAALSEAVPARRDRYLSLELGLGKELADGLALQIGATAARNDANSPLYENRYRQLSLTLAKAW
jgi:hypothetical protein